MLEDSVRKSPYGCDVRDLRVGMCRKREMVHGEGGRKLRVRWICNVAKNVVTELIFWGSALSVELTNLLDVQKECKYEISLQC